MRKTNFVLALASLLTTTQAQATGDGFPFSLHIGSGDMTIMGPGVSGDPQTLGPGVSGDPNKLVTIMGPHGEDGDILYPVPKP